MHLSLPSGLLLQRLQKIQKRLRLQQGPDLHDRVEKLSLLNAAVRRGGIYRRRLLHPAEGMCVHSVDSHFEEGLPVSQIGAKRHISGVPPAPDAYRHILKGKGNRRLRLVKRQLQALDRRKGQQDLSCRPLRRRLDQKTGFLRHDLRDLFTDRAVIGGKAQVILLPCLLQPGIQDGVHNKALSQLPFLFKHAVSGVDSQSPDPDLIHNRSPFLPASVIFRLHIPRWPPPSGPPARFPSHRAPAHGSSRRAPQTP